MHALIGRSLQQIDQQVFLRQCLLALTFEPLRPTIRVLDLLGAQVFDPRDRQADAHHCATLLHLQRLGSGSLGNPLR